MNIAKSQKYWYKRFKQAMKFTDYLQEKNRIMKIQTKFKDSVNVALIKNK